MDKDLTVMTRIYSPTILRRYGYSLNYMTFVYAS